MTYQLTDADQKRMRVLATVPSPEVVELLELVERLTGHAALPLDSPAPARRRSIYDPRRRTMARLMARSDEYEHGERPAVSYTGDTEVAVVRAFIRETRSDLGVSAMMRELHRLTQGIRSVREAEQRREEKGT